MSGNSVFNANVVFRWKEEMRKKGVHNTARCREQAEATADSSR